MIKFTSDKNESIAKQICRHSGLPFSVVQKKLRSKEVMVNNARVDSGNVNVGDEIIVFAKPKTLSPKIIFEDDKVLVADKPRGIESEDYAKQLGFNAVHRLDRNTCGVFIMAKTKKIREALMQALSKNPPTKIYLAKVFGQPKWNNQIFTAHLEKRADESFVKIHSKSSSKTVPIQTTLTTIKTGSVMSIIEVKLQAGKTHQIRAHLAHLGFPVVGDEKYGNAERNKTFKSKYQELYAIKIDTRFDDDFEYLNNIKFEAKYTLNT